MASKLDRSLDEILAERPRGARRGGKRGGAAAPAGGIRKPSQRGAAQKANASIAQAASKGASKATPTGPANKVTSTKILVSNLPVDVNESMIKEYFSTVVGPLKRVLITYGPNGVSRGFATVEFVKPNDASTAAAKYNGVVVDKKPMKVELIVDPNAPPSFADRVGPPNPIGPAKQPKTAQPKPANKATRGRGRGRGGAGAAGRPGRGRGKPKTAEELDQEMKDYWGTAGNSNDGAAGATNNTADADVGMDDTVL